ncbi:MAG: ABC transporter ATP-binding protein [Chitinispirillaceae bacterium]|nr:ABC transporter ATP-binding protein [Chitinispirillaceae bacterium]
MSPVIEVDSITKSFGKYQIISSVSMHIEPGCIYGLVGLNGAGKTTLLRLMLGILKPDNGSISINGNTPWDHHPLFYRNCGVVLENDGFWGNLTARENCAIYASAKGITRSDLESYLATSWSSTGLFAGEKKVRHFSRGQRMQCALCRAFIGAPTVCFLDEPALALDLNAYNHFKQLATDARDRGAALIISSHQLDTIDELCDRVGILRDGTITEISRNSTDENWYIATGDNRIYGTIITENGGRDVQYDKGWHFTLEQVTVRMPVIIRTLVESGAAITEVRREDTGFSPLIRTHYTGNTLRKESE